ncbi:MAG: PKD domain-containing protein [Thermotogota bacterium]
MRARSGATCCPGGLRLAKVGLFVAVVACGYWLCLAAPAALLNFKADPREKDSPPLEVTFTANAPASTTHWYWQFGDGGSGEGETTTHTYTSPGTYTVKLRVTLPLRDGGERTITEVKPDYITVGPREIYVGHTPGHDEDDSGPDRISVINTLSDPAVVELLDVDQDPFAFALNGATAYLVCYRTNEETGSVFVIDTATNTFLTEEPLSVGRCPRAIAITGSKAYVANYGSDTVTVINLNENRVETDIAVGHNPGRGPKGIAIGKNRAFVANYGDGSVTVINTITDRPVGDPIPVGVNPREILISGNRAWVVCENRNYEGEPGSVWVIDTKELEVVEGGEIVVGQHPRDIAISEKRAFVVCQGSYDDDVTGAVYVINTRTLEVIRSTSVGSGPALPIPVGVHPRRILINGNRAYVVNHGNFVGSEYSGPSIGTVSVINIRTCKTIRDDPIEVGLGPEELAISGDKVYVADAEGDTISVIDTKTNSLWGTITVAPAPTRIIAVP